MTDLCHMYLLQVLGLIDTKSKEELKDYILH